MFATIDVEAAARRLEGVIEPTPLVSFPTHDARVELRLKLECRQVTGAFKARGAWNQVSQLSPEQRAAGVVTVSSGNHGKALSWAARRAGVRATIVMPRDAYPNKIAACRELGAEVVLAKDRFEGEAIFAERVAAGAVPVPPYDSDRTIEGAGTVGLELARAWPEVDVVLVPAGGGGLLSGCAIALRRALGDRVRVIGVEPEGAPTLTLGLRAGEPVRLTSIETKVQGLCPPAAGKRNVEICRALVDRVVTLPDAPIFEAQRTLVRSGEVVEPAGAAAFALVASGALPEDLLAGRGDRLRIVAVVSGGNPDPDQLASLSRG